MQFKIFGISSNWSFFNLGNVCTNIPIPPEETNLVLSSSTQTQAGQVKIGNSIRYTCKTDPIDGAKYINAFEDDKDQDSIEVKCEWNNIWSNVTWPKCIASRFYLKNYNNTKLF